MINRLDLLDPGALEDRSEYEKSVVEGAQNAGHGPHCRESGSRIYGGALHQVINPRAIMAAECGAPGCDSDISDGISELRESFEL